MRIFLAIMLCVFVTSAVEARPQLRASFPKNGQHLMFHRPLVGLTFTDPVAQAAVSIIDPLGREIVDGEPKVLDDPTDVAVRITAVERRIGLVPGEYLVKWTITTTAGETASDTFSFTVMRH